MGSAAVKLKSRSTIENNFNIGTSIYNKLCSQEASIALVGLGYVGLPIALEFAKDFKVIGFDINENRVELMKTHEDPSGELSEDEFEGRNITFHSNPTCLKEAEVIVVAVPTPIDKNKTPNLKPLEKACIAVASNLQKGNYVIFESTVYPGCTEEICVPILERVSGLKYNQDFKVGYSPERINPGDKKNTLRSITKIVSGSDIEASREIFKIYDHIIDAGIHLAPSIKVAEAAKVVENTQRDVNIGLMNELSGLFEKLGINTHDVLEAAGTKWNFLNFYPGLVGGHCIGVDPYYLLHKGKSVGQGLPIIKSTRYVNDKMPSDIVLLVEENLKKINKSLSDSKVLILGSTFKENVTDLRNSKPAEMAQIFKSTAQQLDVIDPLASHYEMLEYYGINLTNAFDHNYDVIIYAVNHKEFQFINWELISDISSEKSIILDFKRTLGPPKDLNKQLHYITL